MRMVVGNRCGFRKDGNQEEEMPVGRRSEWISGWEYWENPKLRERTKNGRFCGTNRFIILFTGTRQTFETETVWLPRGRRA